MFSFWIKIYFAGASRFRRLNHHSCLLPAPSVPAGALLACRGIRRHAQPTFWFLRIKTIVNPPRLNLLFKVTMFKMTLTLGVKAKMTIRSRQGYLQSYDRYRQISREPTWWSYWLSFPYSNGRWSLWLHTVLRYIPISFAKFPLSSSSSSIWWDLTSSSFMASVNSVHSLKKCNITKAWNYRSVILTVFPYPPAFQLHGRLHLSFCRQKSLGANLSRLRSLLLLGPLSSVEVTFCFSSPQLGVLLQI